MHRKLLLAFVLVTALCSSSMSAEAPNFIKNLRTDTPCFSYGEEVR